jgi:hypothetical protein
MRLFIVILRTLFFMASQKLKVIGANSLGYLLRMMLLAFLFSYTIATNKLTANATNPFQTGKWSLLSVGQGGLFKLTYQDLVSQGFDPKTINPNTYRLFVIQGTGYPDLNSLPVSPTAPEVPLYIEGAEDGSFDLDDYILFYIQPTIVFDSEALKIKRNRHQYARQIRAYFGSDNTHTGKRLKTPNASAVSGALEISSGCILNLLEQDLVNPLGMGRVWLGERLGNETNRRSYTLNIPDGADSTWLNFRIGASMIQETGTLDIDYGTQKFSLNLRRNISGDEVVYSQEFVLKTNETGNFQTQLTLNRNNTQSAAYLDYILLQSFGTHAKVNAKNWYYPQLEQLNLEAGVLFHFPKNYSDFIAWEVSNPYNPKFLTSIPFSEYHNFYLDSFSAKAHLMVVPKNEIVAPTFLGSVNQSKINEYDVQTLYITTPEYYSTLMGLNWAAINPDSKVVTVDEIYQQYSGGEPDLGAIRAYLRFLYHQYKDIHGQPKLKYVTLVGSTSYDFFDRIPNNTNHIPIYQSFGEQKTSNYSLDDYLGYLTDGEGDPRQGQSKLNVIIGRIPARSKAEIGTFFDKMIAYKSDKSFGPWRNRITFVADDIDEPWEREFTLESEDYARFITKNHSYLRVNRLYADAFVQKTNGNNEFYPDVTRQIKKTFEDGSLFINYQGHGGETGWGQEAFFDIPTINSLSNPNNYPVLFTATCEFSRYDNPNLQSAGEKTLFRPKGGAVALMTTTRTVWVSGNSIINEAFWKNYGFPKPNEPIPTLGELYGRMKNRPRLNSEDYKFALLGDPSMKLAFPEHIVQIDSINNMAFDEFKDTLKAFSIMHIKGHVNERLKGALSDFNGNLFVEIFDKPIQQFTLDNDNVGFKIPFLTESSVIFKGNVSVTEGHFQFSFAIPKDIAYQFGEGRCVFYAHDQNKDAAGSWKFIIGGSQDIKDLDTTGPKVQAFMGDTTFINGGKVQANTKFVAKISDASGLNATGAGIGRDMVLTIDAGTKNEKSFIVNEYFSYLPNSYQTGLIDFPLFDLTPGKHTARITVWDIYNNSSNTSVNFEVGPARELIISQSQTFPNPIKDLENLRFSLIHNMPNEDVEVEISIATINGSIIWKNKSYVWSAPTNLVLGDFSFGGSLVTPGLYVYHIKLMTKDGLSAFTSGKIVKP